MTKQRDDSIWAYDSLGRAEDADFLKRFLISRVNERRAAGLPASYVLNINARWGQGKSFFLHGFGQMLLADGYLVAEVNAWQDDHAEDPLLSVMDAIDLAVAPLIKKEKKARAFWNAAKNSGGAIAVAAARGAVVQLAKKVIGPGVESVNSILEDVDLDIDAGKTAEEISKSLGETISAQGKALLASFRESKRTIASFRSSLGSFLKIAAVKGQKLPLFVLIDELDRCRPPFAIAMLERIKHLFDIDDVVFVVATDTTQLSHSIGAVYGTNFDGRGYLARFFNRTYNFEEASRGPFIKALMIKQPLDESKISLPPNVSLIEFMIYNFDYYNLELRGIQQVYDIIRSMVSTWNIKIEIEMLILIPVAIAHQCGIELVVNAQFNEKADEIARSLGGTKLKWSIQFSNDSYRGAGERLESGGIIRSFVAQAVRPLPSVYEQPPSNEASRWINGRFSQEFVNLHGRTRSPLGPLSVVLKYPELVRSAGRLSNSKLTDE